MKKIGPRRTVGIWQQRIPWLGMILSLLLAEMAAASNHEVLQAATVKITVQHSKGISLGSGIVLCQREGRVDILTAKHVVLGVGLPDENGAPSGSRFLDPSTKISFYRNSPLPVRDRSPAVEMVINKAESKDVALITLSGIEAPLKPARLGSAADLSPGDLVTSVGHLDVDWDLATGTVRTVSEFIRHSSSIGAGYSGGPLYNTSGEVVGVNLQMIHSVARAMLMDEALRTIQRWVHPECLRGARPLEDPVDKPPPIAAAVNTPREDPVDEPAAQFIGGERESERVAGVEFAWRYIPQGTFQMGSATTEVGRSNDETRHKAKLSRAFWIGETEVTQGQWHALMGNNPAGFRNCGTECPVERVNWYEALAFANELSRRSKKEECYEFSGGNRRRAGDGLEYPEVKFKGLECRGYRLPTEVEWEYAARANSPKPFWTGTNLTTEQANYDGNHPYSDHAKGKFRNMTVKVRKFGANSWGLYEVHGNLWEWTQDAADLDLEKKPAEVVTTTYRGNAKPFSTKGPFRVIRGGSWWDNAQDCRAANRNASPPDTRNKNIGFRLVRTYQPE